MVYFRVGLAAESNRRSPAPFSLKRRDDSRSELSLILQANRHYLLESDAFSISAAIPPTC